MESPGTKACQLSAASMIHADHIRALMSPKGVAIVGATERSGSVGRTICENVMAGKGSFEIHLVNPNRDKILGLPCADSVSTIKGHPELVIVVTPAASCVTVLEDCAKHGSVRCVIIIAAGFAEIGEEGRKLEARLVDIAAANNIAIVGPNCLGVQSPIYKLNASFAASNALPGNCAFISQSGAMCTAVLDWSLQVGFGYSAFVSLGSMSHVDWASLIEYYGNDENTTSIMIYMESVGRAGAFMQAARRVSRDKPIIIIKAGRSAAAAAAAISHTGAMVGSHSNFLAAMRRAGCLLVDSIDEFQHTAMMTSYQEPPTGDNVIIITNAGGPGVLCTDAAANAGLNIVDLPPVLIERLNAILPSAWSHSNPVDILGDARADLYGKTLELVLEHAPPACSVLIICSPQSVTQPDETSTIVCEVIKKHRETKNTFKGPILCAWMGGKSMENGRNILNKNRIPCFVQPDLTAQALGIWVKQRKMALQITEVPSLSSQNSRATEAIFEKAFNSGRNCLSEAESKEILALYDIPVVQTIICENVEACASAAAKLGYPVVAKVHGGKFTHKSDIGGVKLNLKSDAEVRAAFEEIKQNYEALDPGNFEGVTVQQFITAGGVECVLGCVEDVQFGPMILFGAGGVMVEILHDAAVTLAPLDEKEAELLVSQTLIAKALEPHGERFSGCDKPTLYKIISKFSIMCADLWPYITEVEINPIALNGSSIHALDARVVLRKKVYENYTEPCMLFSVSQ